MDVSKFSSSIKKYIKESEPAPVHLWNPPYCGELDIRITRDGNWHYNKSPIGRKRLVKLFSNILKKEGDFYYLVTPVEKIKIQVDDAPFLIVDIESKTVNGTQEITFLTNTENEFSLGLKNPLRILFKNHTQEPSPYVVVRKNLEGLIDRKTFYRLIEKSDFHSHKGASWLGIWSQNVFFPILEENKLNILD